MTFEIPNEIAGPVNADGRFRLTIPAGRQFLPLTVRILGWVTPPPSVPNRSRVTPRGLLHIGPYEYELVRANDHTDEDADVFRVVSPTPACALQDIALDLDGVGFEGVVVVIGERSA